MSTFFSSIPHYIISKLIQENFVDIHSYLSEISSILEYGRWAALGGVTFYQFFLPILCYLIGIQIPENL